MFHGMLLFDDLLSNFKGGTELAGKDEKSEI